MAQSKDIRWKQRFENFERAWGKLQAFSAHADTQPDEIAQVALVGAFEFTFELGWKTLKDYLNYNGISVSLPREVLKQGFHHQLLTDGQVWIDMLQDRNLLSHVYDEMRAKEAVTRIQSHYIPAIRQLIERLAQER